MFMSVYLFVVILAKVNDCAANNKSCLVNNPNAGREAQSPELLLMSNHKICSFT